MGTDQLKLITVGFLINVFFEILSDLNQAVPNHLADLGLAARDRLSLFLPLSFSPSSYFLSFSIKNCNKWYEEGKIASLRVHEATSECLRHGSLLHGISLVLSVITSVYSGSLCRQSPSQPPRCTLAISTVHIGYLNRVDLHWSSQPCTLAISTVYIGHLISFHY